MFPSEIYNSENFNSLTGQVQELTDISLGRGPSCEMQQDLQGRLQREFGSTISRTCP